MIQRKIMVDVTLSPDELAFEFANMGDEQQAMFFNELAIITAKWGKPVCFQLQSIIDHPALMSFEQEFAKNNTGTPFYHVAKYWYELGEKAAATECYQIVGDTMEHLASPIAPYNHGVLDTKIAARKTIKEKFAVEI